MAAQSVKGNAATEGCLRSAISRAYYSVFLTVRDQIFGEDGKQLKNNKLKKELNKSFQTKTKNKRYLNSHEIVIFALSQLKSTVTLQPLALSQQLRQLREARVYADYTFNKQELKQIPFNNWTDYAKQMVALTSQILPIARRIGIAPAKQL